MLIINKMRYNIIKLFSPEKAQKIAIASTASSYDMYTEENEKYYSKIYLYFIEGLLTEYKENSKLKILDIGCGQGRLTIPLARFGHDLIGFDISPHAIKSAKKYATKHELSNIDFKVGDIDNLLSSLEDGSFDCVICTEVLYMLENYEATLKEMHRILRKNGLLIISLRNKYFYLLHTLKNKRFKDAKQVASSSSGFFPKLNWHTRDEIENLLTALTFKDIKFKGIGICSGIEGDPYACIVKPDTLSKEEQEVLFEIETKYADMYPDTGRYMFVSSIKHED